MSGTTAGKPSFLVRFKDGPLGGAANVFLPQDLFGWPLPERLGVLTHPDHTARVAFWDADDVADAELPEVLTGSPDAVVYTKLSQSQLPEDVPNVVRGAEYQLEVTS